MRSSKVEDDHGAAGETARTAWRKRSMSRRRNGLRWWMRKRAKRNRAKAEANVAAARAQYQEARAVYEKSLIRAPMDGVILRKLKHTGESVSTQFDSPVITMADDSVLRVRMDVDETDVAKLKVEQRAYAAAEAYGDQKFEGRVIRVGRILGKKSVRTDEPTEHVDTKIL